MFEISQLKEKKLSKTQLNQYKKQLIGQIAIGMENKSNLMINHARSVIAYDKPVSFKDTVKNIEELTSDHLIETAIDVFNDSKMGSLTFLPSKSES